MAEFKVVRMEDQSRYEFMRDQKKRLIRCQERRETPEGRRSQMLKAATTYGQRSPITLPTLSCLADDPPE